MLGLAFDLLSEGIQENAKNNLLKKIKEADNHLRTGFLGTPLLSQVLDDTGEIDLMYTLLFNETYPSWFYSINQGATTVWERWNSYSKVDGYNPDSMNSLNHYAYGAIGEWMYERIAGIAPLEAGYKTIRIAPEPREPLTSASASVNTPYGMVSSSWQMNDTSFNLDIVIPPNTTAEVHIPKRAQGEVLINGNPIEDSSDVVIMDTENNSTKISVQPGEYNLESNFDK